MGGISCCCVFFFSVCICVSFVVIFVDEMGSSTTTARINITK